MGLRLSPALNYVTHLLSSFSNYLTQTSNTAMVGLAHTADPGMSAVFMEGTVQRAGVGFYDLTVHIPNHDLVSCTVLTNMVSNLYGVSECALPVEGSRVLVYMDTKRANHGIVIGVIPPYDRSPPSESGKTVAGFAGLWEYESFASVGSDAAHFKPQTDTEDLCKVNANASRPLDIQPGTYAVVNDQQVGFAVTPLAVTIKATARAQVRCGAIDDQVRIVSGFFQHLDAAGTLQCFNDGGYVSEERGLTSYQCERAGYNSIGTESMVKDATSTLSKQSLVTSVKKQKRYMTNRKRMQLFMGYLGDMVNLFIAKPDPALEPETEEDENKDQGLMHVHTDASGRLLIRSANGIQLQRWDRIPVPKRIYQPWEPEGDKVEDSGDPEPKEPFKWDEGHPYGHSLQLRDANAWRYLGAYWHLHNQSTAKGKKDFYIPEESELSVPDNAYDKPGKGTEEYKKYDKRQAGLSIEEDGSIIIRDAWGSEILMRGGNIILNAAAQIEVRSGKSTVVMAGADAVIKGRYSVDINATERDVRIKADRNLHMLAEGRVSGGSILLESKATGQAGVWDGKGEESKGKGIVLKAKESSILATAKKVHLSGEQAVMVETFGEDSGSNNGTIMLSANKIWTSALRQTLFATGDESCVYISPKSAYLVAPNTKMLAGSNAAVIKGSKYALPFMWLPILHSPYEDFKPLIKQVSADYLQKVDWLSPYTPEARKNVRFTYRVSKEYGTLKATEIKDGEAFYVYQPFWAYMANAGSELVPVTPEGWKDYAIEDTKPWPGKEAEAASYVKLESEENVVSETGIANNRVTLKPNGGPLEPHSFDEYEVAPHQ